MDVGDIWAYRLRGRKPLTPASIETLGERRVEIQHLGDAGEGLVEWVPPARLKCPWVEKDRYLEREARWDTISGRERPSWAHRDAAWEIFRATVPADVAEIYYNNATGISEIHDLRRLSELTGIEPHRFVAYETAFIEDEALYVPWDATLLIARTMAPQAASRLLRRVEANERREAEYRNEHGTSLVDAENPATDTPWEKQLAFWEESKLEMRETIRMWAGVATPTVADETARLRAYVERLISLSARAASELPSVRTKRATALAAEIEETIAELRRDV